LSQQEKYFCDKCDNYCNVEYGTRVSDIQFKEQMVTIDERYAFCTKCGSEVYDENLGNETLIKASARYHEIMLLI